MRDTTYLLRDPEKAKQIHEILPRRPSAISASRMAWPRLEVYGQFRTPRLRRNQWLITWCIGCLRAASSSGSGFIGTCYVRVLRHLAFNHCDSDIHRYTASAVSMAPFQSRGRRAALHTVDVFLDRQLVPVQLQEAYKVCHRPLGEERNRDVCECPWHVLQVCVFLTVLFALLVLCISFIIFAVLFSLLPAAVGVTQIRGCILIVESIGSTPPSPPHGPCLAFFIARRVT